LLHGLSSRWEGGVVVLDRQRPVCVLANEEVVAAQMTLLLQEGSCGWLTVRGLLHSWSCHIFRRPSLLSSGASFFLSSSRFCSKTTTTHYSPLPSSPRRRDIPPTSHIIEDFFFSHFFLPPVRLPPLAASDFLVGSAPRLELQVLFYYLSFQIITPSIFIAVTATHSHHCLSSACGRRRHWPLDHFVAQSSHSVSPMDADERRTVLPGTFALKVPLGSDSLRNWIVEW